MENSLNLPFTIIEFVFALGLLIFVHELGHFLMAKYFNIAIEEFGFGYPPRIVKLFRLGETDITLNWIPFGGFVRTRGENDPDVPGGLAAANPYARLAVLFGGPIMNILTGIFLFSIVITQLGAPDNSTVQIIEVSNRSPAENAGLLPDDIIIGVNGIAIDSMQKLSETIQDNLGKEITIIYQRNGQQYETNAIPRINIPPGEGALGIMMGNPTIPITWLQAVPMSIQLTYEQAKQLVLLPSKLANNEIPPEQARILGPVGIFGVYQQARELDAESSPHNKPINVINTLWTMGIISVAIGFTNLLPIPALDGGRILFVLPELIFGRRIPVEYENVVHFIGFATLILLLIYITTQDIINPVVIP